MQITIAIKVRFYHVKLLRKGVSELLRSIKNEAKKNAEDTKSISDSTSKNKK
ncbi:hypothetical protein T4B_6438 [Trichinella pseudospiralis]|uniref:Uncharacterized protein n=1 Tax=Trichinella pseudospiralis TaxID=6337 RepID=A0A0V1GHQ1_TRIPS|nr:hypothetical protein T4B_6438 [Trichinella pseudospiralis]